jgi:hypothetical protein
VIFKAEVVRLGERALRDNPRFVITNLPQTPQWIYEHVYCERGDIENRIKELHDGLEIDRTSCAKFWANQFRVLLTAAAYVLLQEVRLRAPGTECARAQVGILRERLLKLGARWRSPSAAWSCIGRSRFHSTPVSGRSPWPSARRADSAALVRLVSSPADHLRGMRASKIPPFVA